MPLISRRPFSLWGDWNLRLPEKVEAGKVGWLFEQEEGYLKAKLKFQVALIDSRFIRLQGW
ncbi:hypothetical protein A7Q01_09115 [Eikenella sp. NML96-A-049]|nr:hypothetical protein A7Q01_09115 [Eikenella sp. NML96-A-049]